MTSHGQHLASAAPEVDGSLQRLPRSPQTIGAAPLQSRPCPPHRHMDQNSLCRADGCGSGPALGGGGQAPPHFPVWGGQSSAAGLLTCPRLCPEGWWDPVALLRDSTSRAHLFGLLLSLHGCATVFISSPAEGRLGCFQFLVMMNKAANRRPAWLYQSAVPLDSAFLFFLSTHSYQALCQTKDPSGQDKQGPALLGYVPGMR